MQIFTRSILSREEDAPDLDTYIPDINIIWDIPPCRRTIFLGDERMHLSFPRLAFKVSYRRGTYHTFSLCGTDTDCLRHNSLVYMIPFPNALSYFRICLGHPAPRSLPLYAPPFNLDFMSEEFLNFIRDEVSDHFWSSIFYSFVEIEEKKVDFLKWWKLQTAQNLGWIPDIEFFAQYQIYVRNYSVFCGCDPFKFL